jgi:hypothetical protein
METSTISHGSLNTLIAWEIWLFLVTLASVIFYLLLTRKINTHRLLYEKNQKYNYNWTGVQLLLASVIGVVLYLVQLRDNVISNNFLLPQIPQYLLLILGGSNTFYLSNKLKTLIGKR